MIPHTKAFARYKASSQAHLDFAVFVSHAAPSLVRSLNAGEPVPIPDNFDNKPSTATRLQSLAKVYEAQLARSVLIAVFSYFEAYVKSMLGEVLDFHGGEKRFVNMSERRAHTFLHAASAEVAESRSKLQTYERSARHDRYRKHTKVLREAGYRFPTELLSPFGARSLAKKVSDKKGLRAWEIPDILEHALLFALDKNERSWFEDVRAHRNDVAHGSAPRLSLQYSLSSASKLHAFAARVDRHVVTHFLVVESFAQ